MKFYLRKVYLVILTIQIIIMYLIRYYILKINPTRYTFIHWEFVHEKKIFFENLPIKYLLLFFIWLYLIAIFIPRKIRLFQLKNKKIFMNLFFIQNFFLLLDTLFLGNRMNSGGNNNIILKILEFIFLGIINKEVLLFVVIYITILDNRKLFKIIIIYFIPSMFIGSKAGIIIPCMIIFFLKLGIEKKIVKWKTFFIGISLFFLYPVFTSISWMTRNGSYKFINFEYNYKIYEIFLSLSRRITGIDILNQKKFLINQELQELDFLNLVLYYLKGIIPSSIVNFIFAKGENITYGMLLARIIFKQPIWIISACEATLFGTFYYNSNPIISFIIFNIILIGIIIFIKLNKNKRERNFLLIIFIFSFLGLVMKGNPEEFLIFIRFWFIYLILKNRRKNER